MLIFYLGRPIESGTSPYKNGKNAVLIKFYQYRKACFDIRSG